MVPWLLLIELLSNKGCELSSLVEERIKMFPSSGEINKTVNDADKVIEKVLEEYQDKAKNIDTLDGISIEFEQWRFNLRKSNTEPVVRLNVESKGSLQLLSSETKKLLRYLN